jgi:hypothetical protein
MQKSKRDEKEKQNTSNDVVSSWYVARCTYKRVECFILTYGAKGKKKYIGQIVEK